MFLHSSNLGAFGPGSVVRCTVYLHNGRAQAKNLEEASEADLAAADGGADGMGKGMIMDAGKGMMDAGKGMMDAGKGMMDAGKGMMDAGKGIPGMGHIPDQELGQYVGSDPLW